MDRSIEALPRSILVVDDEPINQQLLNSILSKAGFDVIIASNGKEALQRVNETTPDIIISDIMMSEMDGFSFLKELRSKSVTAFIPVIFLSSKSSCEDIIDGLNLGADDYLSKPFDPEILLARVKSKLNRPPIPVENLIMDRQTGLHSMHNFRNEASREIFRASKGGRSGCLAYLEILETTRFKERLGDRAEREISKQISDIIQLNSHSLDIFGHEPSGRFYILYPEKDQVSSQKLLIDISHRIAEHNFVAQNEMIRLTPVIGYYIFENEKSFDEVSEKSLMALEYAHSQMDLEPKIYNEEAKRVAEKLRKVEVSKKKTPLISRLYKDTRTIIQLFISLFLYLLLPFWVYVTLDRLGADISIYVYYVVVVSLLITAIMIWIEGFQSLKEIDPPENINIKYPPASAIIAAYLPNEAYTIVDTIKCFLELDYPGPLQIILAYNTPQHLPVEVILQQIAEKDKRLMLLKVDGSESKSQNVNAAIAHLSGEFVGIFDADHQPVKNAFTRAWQWLSSSCDIVQGHCLVRNYHASWVARMIAVEFESIYAVSHPGRTRLYGFGIFGGSNGYWKTELLRQTRMHGFMLTEDIDSSMRVTEGGHIIITDPKIISRELAPGTLKALWNQRIRWSQGWFQVSLGHFLNAIRTKNLTIRQKIGATYLLAWREIYPWLSSQMFPIIAFWVWKFKGLDKLNWLIPIFLLTTLFTLSVGPGQTLFAYIKSEKEIKDHKSWFIWYLFFSSLFYTELKNIIARVAQIKEITGEKNWRVTPRTHKP
jgi:DNA-binding response OmpR family regulator/cellulose synthase/poly-beta-1,6-N-acetylglucosamine synthase-like glycosyltransferase